MKHALLLILAALFTCATAARATDEHTYTKGEYALIRDGLAPDKRKSLAAHGDGDGGRDNFHVWLMAEPVHRKLMALDDIDARLDSGPNAYYAFWSKDSRPRRRHLSQRPPCRGTQPLSNRRPPRVSDSGAEPVQGCHQPRSQPGE